MYLQEPGLQSEASTLQEQILDDVRSGGGGGDPEAISETENRNARGLEQGLSGDKVSHLGDI